jgi:hypothetical protein
MAFGIQEVEVELLTVQLFPQTHYVVLYLSAGAPVIPEDSPRIRSDPVKERALSPHKYPYGPCSRGRGGDEPANSSGMVESVAISRANSGYLRNS